MRYTNAITRLISSSIGKHGLTRPIRHSKLPFNYERATCQHNTYLDALCKAGVHVTVLPSDDHHPDCVFVEDTAVVIGDDVMITNPTADSRKPEVNVTVAHFHHFQRYSAKNITQMSGEALCDGGDVFFTGKEIFVGLSRRTNQAGVDFIAKTFPKYPVHAITVGGSTLHLKCFTTLFGEDLIAFGSSEAAQAAKSEMLVKAHGKYDVVDLEDDDAANAVLVNNTLIYQEMFSDSIKRVEHKLRVKPVAVNMDELMKIDGSLTCCSVLYNEILKKT